MASRPAVGGWLVAAALTMVCVASLWSQPAVAYQDELAAGSEPGALFTRYCIGCHNTRLRTAGLAIDELDLGVRHRVAGGLRDGAGPVDGGVEIKFH